MNVDSVKEVRNRSFAPLNECRSALKEANGNVDQALIVLQQRGILRAQASSVREASEGVIHSYVHNGRIAVMIEVNCETDFAARNPLFQKFVDDLAMHIAAANPLYQTRDSIDMADFTIMRDIFDGEIPKGKPVEIANKILSGKFEKWYAEVCLMDQHSLITENGQTIEQLRAELSSQLGENVVVRRFTRWELGDNQSESIDS